MAAAPIGAGQSPGAIEVAPAALTPEIHDLLASVSACRFPAASWSLEPARHL
ncbi:MAG: hypothetical protein JXR96_10275 [Deltaproteobacteria bacterium]|nr:hypothetical protein [Deltaproteobacteria bacterium]